MADGPLIGRSGGGGRPVGALTRALTGITIGTVKDREKTLLRVETFKLREHLFEYQITISGVANARAIWTPFMATFPSPMIPAPLQRDSEFETPHFWFGYELHESSIPVAVVGHVKSWVLDESDYTTGAMVQVGAFTPGEDSNTAFSGIAHLTFQGFTSPALSDDDDGS